MLVVDPELQWAANGVTSTRHRVKNNPPGTPAFCPIVFATKARAFQGKNLAGRARAAVADVPGDLLAAGCFPLAEGLAVELRDRGRASDAGPHPVLGPAIGEAGRRPIDRHELLRLQRIVIGDARFVHLGLRTEDGFVGEHDRHTRMPLPPRPYQRAA